MASNNSESKGFLKDLFSVMIGVLLAFGLNSWYINADEKRQISLFLEGIQSELEDNKKELERAIEYHSGLLETLQEKPLEAVIVLNAPNIINAAWKLAENPVFKKHVSHETYKDLIKTYQVHDIVYESSMEASRLMGELNIFSPFYLLNSSNQNLTKNEKEEFRARTKRSWIPIFESWIFFEKTYLKRIESTLNNI